MESQRATNNASHRWTRLACIATVPVLIVASLVLSLDFPNVQLSIIGTVLSVGGGLLYALVTEIHYRLTRQQQVLTALPAPFALTTEPELFSLHNDLAASLVALADQSDILLRELAMLKLQSMAEDVQSISDGRVVFTATESWRKIYERILRMPGIGLYQSVAVVRTEDYWRDIPGERSMQLNFELLREGVSIERILVISDFLWPPKAILPATEICQWIDRQQEQGVRMYLVRESELAYEHELLADFGIYGDRATGIQELDADGRTQRFVLDFARRSVKLARDRWERLSVYAVSYSDLLQQSQLKE